MISGPEMINNITEKIFADELPYQNHVIIGDNSSGKTMLLKLFAEKAGGSMPVYFIDTVNRGFNVKKISRTEKKPAFKKTILETRLREEYFNLTDSFNCFGTMTERVEMIYQLYETEVQNLFYEFTHSRFDILYDEVLGEVDFGDSRGLLSSGYQAVIRMFLELLYYQDMEINQKSIPVSWVMIDEIDEFLSPRYAAVILEFLKKKFSWGKWMVTTHSCDLVANTQDANLIVLENGNCEVIDINDYASVSEVQIIFHRLFGNDTGSVPQTEQILRRLLNNKMNHAWGKQDEECLLEMEKQKLTASQQIIVAQIREW